ncbi:TetR/AcrR family transcriptional regulator C-terminal domain-containing protein [Streptomyces olivaceus]|uniref:TetR/AcrR family transcriptional regulator C-terminal domain-containing protein n=1 Tax=Streptomyces TaxID=1883 RepID=UPI001CCFA28B|nr:MULTISPECIES: TetR/AcrR family transcriptional regulator C-terminal domain-containing protein [Streptomyces]MBZ6083902.1 TetR/AcrR family transcriptional regulator C-terminal domain-containing protein [Streptomyces olivaceus]MBZ6205978.1 TetR/AcrR family transcriptional regulator C-terminal domain-containing protein [Streptomyces olivaceus]MBZ6282664.1 TetR/AcrR family transcriptional regulator C-terminal domain-containing protein [Streptomyces olivaceus]MCC2266254.1 TetR/AcrR family transcr
MNKGITREQIVTAALELLDDQGMDAVTVRALASRLDVRPSALYWHVRNKQELLDEMATEVMRRVAGAFAAVPPGDGWRDDLAAYTRVLRSEYLLHRDGARIFSGTRITDPDVVRMKEPLFERWTASGWKPADADDAIDLVTAFAVGFVIEEQERRQAAEDDPSRYSIDRRDDWLGEGASLVKEAGHLRDDGDRRFERLLGMVLDGIAARLET